MYDKYSSKIDGRRVMPTLYKLEMTAYLVVPPSVIFEPDSICRCQAWRGGEGGTWACAVSLTTALAVTCCRHPGPSLPACRGLGGCSFECDAVCACLLITHSFAPGESIPFPESARVLVRVGARVCARVLPRSRPVAGAAAGRRAGVASKA